MKIYAINLDTSVERWSTLQSNFSEFPFEISRVSAVDGRALSSLQTAGYSKRGNRKDYGRLLTPGEVGCYASHLKAAQQFLDDGQQSALVLEDDAVATPNAAPALVEIQRMLPNGAIPSDWKLINLVKPARTSRHCRSVTNDVFLCEAIEFPTVATGMIWSRAGAAEFIARFGAITMPVDQRFRDWLTREGGGFGLSKGIISVSGATSDIGSGTSRREQPFLEGVRYDISRAKRDILNSYYSKKRNKSAR